MADPQGPESSAPKVSQATPLSIRDGAQSCLWRTATGSPGRSRVAASSSRESFHGLGMLSASRRGALCEQLGLRGEAPAGQQAAERTEQLAAAAGANASRLCMDAREHAWMLATAEGRFDVLQELLEAEPTLLLWSDPITGYSALHWLAKHGRHEELIMMHDFARLHGLPLDVSTPGSGGLTPLHLATQQGHDMVIKVLVGALGADPMRRDYSGRRPYHYLAPDASWQLRELLGAEEWEVVGVDQRTNANNNSSGGGWNQRRSLHSAAKTAKDSEGSRAVHIQGLLRQLFPFFRTAEGGGD
ncbi:PREDICTED: ankyrin repeat domain-containing protein SOWAHD [Elephantulus edwardii]|uniref:ankyrin repeat domain-containing protein SOWAHD n=1 Tax=Elephantulus edwardii TaxID=28737 RepID=UPI0003F0D6D5|nr:PREDICTED: ankyrin repeat domain-containing protein SOWAHD [Elephantulus edwardii]